MFRDLLKSYQNRKILLLFIMLQLIIAYIIIINAWSTILAPKYKDRIYYSNMNIEPENTYTIWVSSDIYKRNLDNFTQFEHNFFDEVNKNNLSGFGAHFKTEIFINDETVMKGWNDILAKKFKDSPYRTEIIKTDKTVYDLVNIKISEGRSLDKNDFEEDLGLIPVLIGYDLKDVLPIGLELDVPLGKNRTEKYKVVGSIAKGTKWPDKDLKKENMLETDHLIIAPLSLKTRDLSSLDIRFRLNSLVLVSKNTQEETMSLIKVISNKTDIPVIVSRLSDEFMKDELRNTENIKTTIFISALLIAVAISGVIMTTLSTLSERKYELGVRMSVGYTRKDIWKMVLSDLFIKNIIALIIAYTISIVQVSKKSMTNYLYSYELLLDKVMIIAVLSTMAFVILISVIIPRIAINRFKIVDLIRRED